MAWTRPVRRRGTSSSDPQDSRSRKRNPVLRFLHHFHNILIYILLASAVIKAVYHARVAREFRTTRIRHPSVPRAQKRVD
jgi:hypothetical protein